MDNILLPTEIEFYIETLLPQRIDDLGTKEWLLWHQRLQKLNQQALIEASQLKHECVKETLVSFGKIPILVHEAVVINVWKSKVLPQLLKLDPDPKNTFVAYTVLFHEAVCVALLELAMYHAECCDGLGDAAPDLLDYVCGATARLLSVKQKDGPPSEDGMTELNRQMDNLTFDIGIRSLAIVRYMAENLEKLPLCITSAMFETYDVPTLFAQLLLDRPWVNGDKLYTGGKWSNWDGEALAQPPAQVWLTLRHLLLDEACANYYTLTEARRSQLGRLNMLLSEVLLDQLAPLIELKQWLAHALMSGQTAKAPKPVLLEPVLDIKDNILKMCGSRWKALAKKQLTTIFSTDQDALRESAQMLTDAYNLDLAEKFEVKENASCEQCGKDAIQRCSHCKKAWYCSRSCQISHWSIHKEHCNK